MTPQEAFAFGVPEERYKEFREVYNRDLNNRVAKRTAEKKADATMSAILAMLPLIKNQETMQAILKYINKAYFQEV